MTGSLAAAAALLVSKVDPEGERQGVELAAPTYVYGLVAFGLLVLLLLVTLGIGKGRPHA